MATERQARLSYEVIFHRSLPPSTVIDTVRRTVKASSAVEACTKALVQLRKHAANAQFALFKIYAFTGGDWRTGRWFDADEMHATRDALWRHERTVQPSLASQTIKGLSAPTREEHP